MIEKDLQLILGKTIKEYRERKGMTQQVLADLSGIQRSHLACLETGEKQVTIKTLVKILSALSINISEFFRTVEKEL